MQRVTSILFLLKISLLNQVEIERKQIYIPISFIGYIIKNTTENIHSQVMLSFETRLQKTVVHWTIIFLSNCFCSLFSIICINLVCLCDRAPLIQLNF